MQNAIIANTSSGGVTDNATLFHVGHSDLPFGGVGDSGIGAYHGMYSCKISNFGISYSWNVDSIVNSQC